MFDFRIFKKPNSNKDTAGLKVNCIKVTVIIVWQIELNKFVQILSSVFFIMDETIWHYL